MISLNDRQPEVVNTTRFTPQAMEQLNRATALIDAYENKDFDNNSIIDQWDRNEIRDQTREDFIAFSSLLAGNYNNPYFVQFGTNVGFSRLFKAYRERNDDKNLVSFLIRVANCKDITAQYLFKAKNYIKHHIVATGGYEEFLRETYNTISEMLRTIKTRVSQPSQ